MSRNAMGGGRVSAFPKKKRYEGVLFKVISVTRGGWGSNSLEKNVIRMGKIPQNYNAVPMPWFIVQ